jgi:LysR family transcriptional regulator, glycine cleavage system transcriptional activator
MHRNLPPLNPLRVFEVAARHVHFTRAAEELGITQAAVSRQILTLENWLNIKLFERRHSELRLTEVGNRYLTAVCQAFDIIESSTTKARGGSTQSMITLRVYATFAFRWLIPRLARFKLRHPEILVDLTTSVTPIQFHKEDAELVIDYRSEQEMEGIIAQRIFSDVIVPVCSPDLLQDNLRIEKAADLAHFTLLHSRKRQSDWSDWANHVGAEIPLEGGYVFDNSSLAYQAAKAGIGIAMGQLHLLEAELASGELIIPFDQKLERNDAYYLLYPTRISQDPRVAAFHRWVAEEAGCA